jgi:DoxX-like family
MRTTPTPTSKSGGRLWTGRVLAGLAVLFLVFDAVIKLIPIRPVVEGMAHLGYPLRLAPVIGILASPASRCTSSRRPRFWERSS